MTSHIGLDKEDRCIRIKLYGDPSSCQPWIFYFLMNHLCEMNFLVVVSVPFTTKNLLPLKGELLKDADACIKYLTLAKVFSKFNSGFFPQTVWNIVSYYQVWLSNTTFCSCSFVNKAIIQGRLAMRLIHGASILLLKTKVYVLNYWFCVSFVFNGMLLLFCTCA